MAVFQQDNVDS